MTAHAGQASDQPKSASSRRRLRPERSLPQEPLPAPPRPERALPDPSDWTFELIEEYHEKIRAARNASASIRIPTSSR